MREELLQGIRGWMEEKENLFVGDIRRLVEIPSVSVEGDGADPYGKDCSRVLEVMRQMARDRGFSGEILEKPVSGDLLGRRREGAGHLGTSGCGAGRKGLGVSPLRLHL